MALGSLDFNIPKPGWLDFGRTSEPGNELSFEATTPGPVGNFEFFVGVRLRADASARWQSGIPSRRECSALAANASAAPVAVSALSQAGSRSAVTTSLRSSATHRYDTAASVRMTESSSYRQALSARWLATAPVMPTWACRWGAGAATPVALLTGWDEGIRSSSTTAIRWASGWIAHRTVAGRWDSGDRIDPTWSILWDNGIRPPHGWRPIPFVPPLPNKVWGRLNFACPKPGRLNFGNTCFGSSRLLVAIRRSYRVLNSAALIRVSDGADIPVSNLTVALDWESWCWTLSATLLGRAAYETVPAAPGLVQATINGFVWQFIPDDMGYNRTFGVFGGQLIGRSRVAELAAPFALARSYREGSLRTGEQLALQELPEGYTLDWQLPEWTVPGGVYQYDNLTPMESITRIVKSAGGRLYPDPVLKTLHAVPKWPQKPWSWSFVTDATLPSSYTLQESLANLAGTDFEAIMASGGVNNGVIAICKIASTGGATYAPSVVDTLITHVDAATPRAVQELADAWPMRRYTLELPLQASPAGAGLILPGTTLDFADGEEDGWRGLVTGVSITAIRESTIQTLEIVSP